MIHVSTRPPKQDPCIITGVSKIPEPRLPAHLGGLQDGSSALSGQLGVLLAKDTKHSIWKRETREKGNSKTTGSNLDQQTGFKNRIQKPDSYPAAPHRGSPYPPQTRDTCGQPALLRQQLQLRLPLPHPRHPRHHQTLFGPGTI